MPAIHHSAATLRISGDDLEPDEITRLLGHPPTARQTNGEVFRHPKSGRERIAGIGMWRLEVSDREPADVNAQVAEILGHLTSDLAVWKVITNRYHTDLFCGLFMESGMEGETLSADTLLALGSRGIEIGLDIYAPGDDSDKKTAQLGATDNPGDAQ